MKSKAITPLIILLVSLMFGCSAYKESTPPVQGPKGKDVVCVLYHDSHFNYLLMEKVSKFLTGKGYKVVTDEEYLIDRYKSSDYAAMVILAKLEDKGAVKIVEDYYGKQRNKGSMIIALSHEWDVDSSTMKKDYDAITAASKDFDQDDVLKAITERLNGVLKK